MNYLLTIRNGKISSDDFEEISLKDIVIDYDGGVVRASYAFQAFLDHQHPERPNKFSIARKLDKYKPKVSKYGSA